MASSIQSSTAVRKPERRALRVLSYLAIGLIAFGALGTSLLLRDEAIEARQEQLVVARTMSATSQQMEVLEDALEHGRLEPAAHATWLRLERRVRAFIETLADENDQQAVLSPLRHYLDEYESASRETLDLVGAGHPTRAERFHERGVHQSLDHAHRLLSVIDREDGEEASGKHSAATVGTLLTFAVAALLIALLLRSAQGSRRRVAVGAAEEAALQQGKRRFRALIESASDMIFVVDRQGLVSLASGAVHEQLGRDAPALVGTRLVDLLHPDDADLALPLLAEAVKRRPGLASGEWRMAREDGSFAQVETVARDLIDDTDVGGFVLTIRDVSERRLFEDQLRHQAFHDPLTYLPNRALFDDRLGQALSREDRHVAVLFLDLDDFKAVNDSLGHAAGDELLIGVASRLRKALRPSDTAARLGGDEFAMVLEGLDDAPQAAAAAARVLDSLQEPFFIHGQALQVQASIGVAVGAADSTRAEQLVRGADLAMYLAKHNGKGRYEVCDSELQGHLLEPREFQTRQEEHDGIAWFLRSEGQRAEVEALLENEDSITPVFQPIVDLSNGSIMGYEALSRFPDQGRPPNVMFAQAHRSGLGVELEMHALRTALRVEGRPPGTFLSLNLSPSAVVSDQLDASLPEDLSSLVFEIVENELIGEGTRLDAAIDRLRRRGARIAVDDTGSGYAGLKQLMRLRPEMIKLDRSLVDGVHGDVAKRALVDAMARYARSIDALVCAEGVESLDDLRELADLDIYSAQGYGLARPGAPWAEVDPEAVAVCARSVQFALGETQEDESTTSSERRLEQVSRAILGASWPADLHRAIEMIAEELDTERTVLLRLSPEGDHLETVTSSGVSTAGERFNLTDYWAAARVVKERHAVQVRVSDPAADPNQAALLVRRGLGSLLMVPVIAGDRVVGVLGSAGRHERPWARSQIYRAWLFAHQLGAALAAFEREGKKVGGRLAHREDFAATGIERMRQARDESSEGS